jgi:hypothetical protein
MRVGADFPAVRAEQVSGAFIGGDFRGGESRTFALATTWRSCSNRESGPCGDADTPAIAGGAVASGPRPGAAAGRPFRACCAHRPARLLPRRRQKWRHGDRVVDECGSAGAVPAARVDGPGTDEDGGRRSSGPPCERPTLVTVRSTNACSESAGLSLAPQPHRSGRHDKQPSNGVARPQQPDHDDHDRRRIQKSQDDHAERILRRTHRSQGCARRAAEAASRPLATDAEEQSKWIVGQCSSEADAAGRRQSPRPPRRTRMRATVLSKRRGRFRRAEWYHRPATDLRGRAPHGQTALLGEVDPPRATRGLAHHLPRGSSFAARQRRECVVNHRAGPIALTKRPREGGRRCTVPS